MTRDELINAIDSPIVQALARVFDTPPQRMDKSFSEQIVEILAPKLINVRAQRTRTRSILQNQIEIMGALSLLLRYAKPDLIGKAGELDLQRDDLLQRHKATQRALAALTSTKRAPCQCCGTVAELACGPTRFGPETWACAECWGNDTVSVTSTDGGSDYEHEEYGGVDP